MAIASDLIRGHTDTIILSMLLKQDRYGYEINKYVQDLTKGSYELKEATLYTAFRRLEKAGYITAYWGDEDRGARRRYYKITQSGIAHRHALKRQWDDAKVTIDLLIGG